MFHELLPLFVYVTDALWGEGEIVEPGEWIDGLYAAMLAEAMAEQRRIDGDLMMSGSPEEGALVVLDTSGEQVLAWSWLTQNPAQAMGFEPRPEPRHAGLG